MAGPIFYPTLGDIIPFDDLPDALGPIKSGLASLFNQIYFKNLQYSRSKYGDAGNYSLDIVMLQGLDINFGGDLKLRFNPSNSGTTAFPITLEYDWKLIRFIRGIKEDGFAETAQEIFDFVPKLLDLGEESLLTMAVAVFEANLPLDAHETGEGLLLSHVNDMVTKVNSEYSLSGADLIPAATGDPLPAIEAVKDLIYTDPHKTAIDKGVAQVIYDVYLHDPDPNVAKDNLKLLFKSIAEDILDFLLELLIPRVEASIELTVGLEFPRTFLVPVDKDGNELPSPIKTIVMASGAEFYFSTETGISHDIDIVVSMEHNSFGNTPGGGGPYTHKIPGTGFTIDFNGLKFDFNEESNIPEADADGRPNTFKGAFIEEVSIGLPKGWTLDGAQAASIKGEDLLIGNEGGLSGSIFLDGPELGTKMGDISVKLTELGIEFHQNEVVEFEAGAAVQIPGLETLAGDPAWITVEMSYDAGLYTITGSGFPALKLFGVGLEIITLGFEFDDTGLKNFSISAKVKIDDIKDGAGDPAEFTVEITKSGNMLNAALTGGSLPGLKLFGIELEVNTLGFGINLDTGQLTAFDIEGILTINQLKKPDNSGPAKIGVDISYATSPSKLFSLAVDSNGFPAAKIGDFALGVTGFGFTFVDGSLSNFNFAGTVAHPELKNAGGTAVPLPFSGSYDGTTFTFAVTPPASGITIKDLPFALNAFSISFTAAGLNAINISGTITLPFKDKNTGNDAQIGVTFEYSPTGFRIAGSATGIILTVEDVLEFAPLGLELGKESGNWFFGMSGTLERLFDVPVVGKFIPEKVIANEFKIVQGSSPEFDLTFEWEDGVSVSGSKDKGLEFIIPVDKTLFNTLKLGSIGLKLKPGDPDGLETEIVLYNAGLELGPFVGIVDGMGLSFDVSFPSPGGGNFGPVQMDIGFIPPTGIGFSLDAGAVKGGGFLSFDHDAGRYAGALELDFAGLFGFTAIGIVTTKLPDGSKGFSLLCLVNVTFGTPIALGFNFYLAGIGGLIGLHRTMDTNAIRLGVKDGSIANILFPENVIANISKIISDLEAIFPMKRDQFFLGLMARITWNTPAILTIEAGLAIEFPNPVKIAILGVIKCVLPTADKAILKLNVAFAGIIDFEKKLLSFDASIYDSRILTITLEGDIALRISWGSKPDFLVSVGGFHPAYTPPEHLELLPMKRMTVNILSGNPNLVLTAYFALTSNTIQFGAALDFSFKISKFGIYGHFGFDVLIQFSPFRFMAGIRASVAVKLGSTTLMSIGLSFNLEGPSPWRAHGHATFKILFIKFKAKFDKTWGEKKENSLPSTPVLPLLLEELGKDSNWAAAPSAEDNELVTLSQAASNPDVVIVRPFGSLEVNQSVVPFDLTMERFGNFKPQDISKVTVNKLSVGGSNFQDGDLQDLKNSFAPSAYKEMSDQDKLKAPSYENQNSGTRLKSTDEIQFDYGINRLVEYETILSDETRLDLNLINVRSDLFRPFVKGGDLGKSFISQKKGRKLKQPAKAVSVGQEKFAVANVADMSNAAAGNILFNSKSEADEYLKKSIADDPSLAGSLQLTPAFQMI